MARTASADLVPRVAVNDVCLGARRVGPGRPAYIVAEIGVNHDGEIQKGAELVAAAARAGADAVKLQIFRAAELTTATAATADYQRASSGDSQQAMLQRLELDADGLKALAAAATQADIDLIATTFALSDVPRATALPLVALKTASTDLNNLPLLSSLLDTRLPLIISTGAATPGEIEAAATLVHRRTAAARCVLLHCVSAYPTPLDAANLRAISSLRSTTGCVVGYSDHTPDTRTGAWAVAAGASVLEKHLTLDPTAPGPDHATSLSPAQFAEYVAEVRAAEAALGHGRLGFAPIEHDVRQVARKSIVAATAIPADTVVTAALLTTKRPGTGIPPDQLGEILGRRTTRPIAADTLLRWEDVQ